jgi:hypothetical protein
MAKKENKAEEPKVDNTVEKIKVKRKPKKFSDVNETIKVDLTKKPEVKEEVTKVDLAEKPEVKEETPVVEAVEEVKETPVKEEVKETPIVEEITNEEKTEVTPTPTPVKQEIKQPELPENIQKLMSFMEETGGDLNDYVQLNRDYSDMDNHTLLREYYKQTKPHLQPDEIDFMMNDQFSYDEEEDETDIKRKKLALKEQVANAKTQLEEYKSKYYEDIKAGSKLTNEQQKAIDFFNRYNKESEQKEKARSQAKTTFQNKTDQLFNDEFKGFEYNVGDKRYRFNVKDVSEVKENQSNMDNFIKKFLNENNQIEDAAGYHKSMFTANNADAIAKHFYEQGKADALKDSMAKSKNIDMSPRGSHGDDTNVGGLKFKVLNDSSTPTFKFKKK